MVSRSDGCWAWKGGTKARGYGHMAVLRGDKWTRVIAHRYGYEMWVGPIPAGFQIDHLCFNPGCVNPEHLEAVTPAENRRRQAARMAARTHCSKGHEFAVTGRYDDGKCSECCRERARTRSSGQPHNSERMLCRYGHPLFGDNMRTVTRSNGRVTRVCRECANRRNREAKTRGT